MMRTEFVIMLEILEREKSNENIIRRLKEEAE